MIILFIHYPIINVDCSSIMRFSHPVHTQLSCGSPVVYR